MIARNRQHAAILAQRAADAAQDAIARAKEAMGDAADAMSRPGAERWERVAWERAYDRYWRAKADAQPAFDRERAND